MVVGLLIEIIHPPKKKEFFMKQFILLAALMVFFAGCNNGQTTPKSEKKMKKLSTLEWAGEVYAIYEESMNELDALTGEKPEATPELKENVKALKNSIIDKMIPYGKMRAGMSEYDQKTSSDQLGVKINNIARNPAWGRTQNEARIHYAKIDAELAALIGSFNIITQYSQFELIKKQEPAEAERLGIE